MPTVDVRDAAGVVVWESPDVDDPIVEVVGRIVRVTNLQTGEVLATYELKPGEKLAGSLPPGGHR